MTALACVTALKPFMEFLGALPLLMLRCTQRKAYQPEWSSYVLILLGALEAAVPIPTSEPLGDLAARLCRKLADHVLPHAICIRHFRGHDWVDRPVAVTSGTVTREYDEEGPGWTDRCTETTSFQRFSNYGLEYELGQKVVKRITDL